MALYTYFCGNCGHEFHRNLKIHERDWPTKEECPLCSIKEVKKMIDAVPFKIKGASAANGYSSTVGDVEKFTGKPYEPED